jgi:GWxTD domain-containing protein
MTRYTILIRLFLITTCAAVQAGCSSTNKISNRNLAYLYSPGSNFIEPEYRIVNVTKDTSRLFFSIRPSDLLYVKRDTSTEFYSSYSISYTIYNSYENKEVVDTGSTYFEYQQVLDSDSPIRGSMDISIAGGSDYVLQVMLTDHHRNQAVATFLELDKTGDQSANNFLVMDMDLQVPLLTDHIHRDTEIRMISTISNRDSIWLRYYDRSYPLPRPPFSASDLKTISYKSDVAEWIRLDERLLISEQGIYHFQFDTLSDEGITLFRFNDDYPRITSAEELIEPLRYLTTMDEYLKLKGSADKKAAIDEFWLQLSGSHERGRVLIKSYYSRVQFANKHFHSYLEGWKTDRGLIYIIFGPPGTIYRSDDSESWNYGQMNSYSSLIFTFDKVENPFTNDDYHLRRAAIYESPWYRAVDSWRSGRVVNDSY